MRHPQPQSILHMARTCADPSYIVSLVAFLRVNYPETHADLLQELRAIYRKRAGVPERRRADTPADPPVSSAGD